MREKGFKLRLALNALGLISSVLPPVLAVLFYFPVWVSEGGEYVMSGVAALLLLAAILPLFKLVKRALSSPSAYMLWLVLFLIFLCVSRIAEEMIVISFIGFIAGVVGAVFFRLARRYGNEK